MGPEGGTSGTEGLWPEKGKKGFGNNSDIKDLYNWYGE